MTEQFTLRTGGQYEEKLRRVEREIKQRVDGCLRPQCWILKDEGDNGRIYLRQKTTLDGKGRYTYIRRYLFLDTYKFIPEGRRLDMLCENKSRCVSPAHATYKGFQRPWEIVEAMKKMNWITEEQAKEMYQK